MQQAYNRKPAVALRGLIAGWVALLGFARATEAQRLLDLPLRTTAGADALATGATAALWNPAGAARMTGRGEATLVDVRGPETIGIDGFGVAGALRLERGLSLALAYQHTGTDDIAQTSTSPLPEESGSVFDLADDVVSIAAAQSIGDRLAAGVTVRYTRSAAIVDDRDIVSIGAGFDYRAQTRWYPTIGAAARTDEDGTTWMTGFAVTPYGGGTSDWSATATWGASGTPLHSGISWRGAARGAWRERVTLSIGVAGEPGADGPTWQPHGALSVRVSRYRIGVLREELPNGFGAFHTFHFDVTF